MSISRQKNTWVHLGVKDPLWAVLTWDDKKNGKWDTKEFFGTGEHDAKRLIEKLKSLDVSEINQKVILDFGCGVGRQAQSFANYFSRVVGVDISQPMIDMANRYNRFQKTCQYIANTEDNLRVFSDSSFDVVYSDMVLQHNRPALIRNYINEFMRVARPGGIIVFQLPADTKKDLRGRILHYAPVWLMNVARMIKNRSLTVMDMYWMDSEEVTQIVESQGGHILEIDKQEDGPGNYINCIYYVRA